jgi:hypothetical protein
MRFETSDSLIPVVPFELYKDQAEELESAYPSALWR